MPELAALSLDLKRAYIELRPRLRRLYAAMAPEETQAGLFRAAGFHALPECTVETDHRPRHSLLLDFGPGSVDGWLSQLVAVTLSDADQPAVRLDAAARELRRHRYHRPRSRQAAGPARPRRRRLQRNDAVGPRRAR